jgi:hypothetical protein
MKAPTFEEDIKADPSTCKRCGKVECTCWGYSADGRSIGTAPTGKAFIVSLKRFYRDWEPPENLLRKWKP